MSRFGAPYDYLVVGAGFAGSVLAERLAAGLGKRVLLIDRRAHVGGAAYDEKDAAGILMHRYGPHIFHTNSDEIAASLALHQVAALRTPRARLDRRRRPGADADQPHHPQPALRPRPDLGC
jgi:choline dehydrogenase-like flavoprotein